MSKSQNSLGYKRTTNSKTIELSVIIENYLVQGRMLHVISPRTESDTI